MHLMDADTGDSLPEPAPFTFSFNSPQGACPRCKGLGFITRIDMDRIIPDTSKSINAGGILPIGKYRDSDTFRILEEPISTEQYAIAFKLGNEALRDQVQETYDEMLADGTVMKVAEKYADDNLPDMLITE